MRIGIDARFYGPRATGIGIYTEELIKNLLKIDQTNQYVIFLRKEAYRSYQIKNKNVEKVLTEIPHYSFKEQTALNPYFKAAKLDLVHFTHFNKPIFYHQPYLVTIHDLTMLFYPPRTNFLKKKIFEWVIKSAVKNALKIIVPSQQTKKDLNEYLNVPTEKIELIYEALPSNFKPAKIKNRTILKKYRITKPYLFYTGQQKPHKNLIRLVEAFKDLNRKYPSKWQLVLAGKIDPSHPELGQKIEELNLKDEVILAGFVRDQDLPQLYVQAQAYVLPSLYEGFGLPPLEAMASKIPVIASSSSCIPEILGDGAYYFDPKNIQEMSRAMEGVLLSPKIRQKLLKNGPKILVRYSWQKNARQTLKIYQNLRKLN